MAVLQDFGRAFQIEPRRAYLIKKEISFKYFVVSNFVLDYLKNGRLSLNLSVKLYKDDDDYILYKKTRDERKFNSDRFVPQVG